MKKRILFLASVFIFFVLVFLLFKSIFTIIYSSMGGGVSASDFFDVLYHGLGLDLSMSGYLTLVPALVVVISLWVNISVVKTILNAYFGIISCVLAAVFIADIAIYPHWGYHFDSSVFLYVTNPIDSLASSSTLEVVLGLLLLILVSLVLYFSYKYSVGRQIKNFDKKAPIKTLVPCIVLMLITASLFLPIRGGITVSTMNVGQAYFSDNMFLNHAAINPHFNLMYSITKSDDFASQYQFIEKEEAEEVFADLMRTSSDSTTSLLNIKRPNVVLFLLESFSAGVAYDSIVAPNFSNLASQGINFSNFYANSFRTDRALVSILSGYPAHPTVALMKYPRKTQTLPSIPKCLIDAGYQSSFYYGGDVDFASMRSYIIGTCGTSEITSDVNFPVSQRLTKWGVPDKYLLERLYDDLTEKGYDEPFIATVLTLSSHEPFDVPTNKFGEPFLDAVNYTDEHLGEFVEKLRNTPLWDNTLIIMLADHCMQSYPVGARNNDPRRFHIPMVWTGGAVAKPYEVSEFGSQNDLSATLLSQLGLGYSDFKFSNNMLSTDKNKFAFYSYNNGFSMRDSTGVITYDNDAEKVLKQEGKDLGNKAKAFFQMMYLDLGER